DVSLDLVEQLAARIDVVIVALVGPADDHHEEIAVPHRLVADGWLQQMTILLHPAAQIDRRETGHGMPSEEPGAPATVCAGRHRSGYPVAAWLTTRHLSDAPSRWRRRYFFLSCSSAPRA